MAEQPVRKKTSKPKGGKRKPKKRKAVRNKILLTGRKGWVQPDDMPDDIAQQVVDCKICGARRVKGAGWCRNKPYKGPAHRHGEKGPWRCKFHGGAAGGVIGNRNAEKHGIYTKALSPEEAELMTEIDPKSVDFEIKITKIRLMRALEKEKQQSDKIAEHGYKSVMEVMETEYKETVKGEETTVKRKAINFDEIISGLIRQLCKLVQTKFQTEGGDVTDLEEIAKRVREHVGTGLGKYGSQVRLSLNSLYPGNADPSNN